MDINLSELISLFTLESIYKILFISLSLFCHLWYILAGGIILGSVISVFVPVKGLSGIGKDRHWMKSVFYASVLGVISPLGSYAVIPIFSALIYSQMPLAPVMAFLIASPLISPIDFLNTWGILGAEMALARLISALLIGIGFGTLFHYLSKRGFSLHSASVGAVKSAGKAMEMINPPSSESRWKTLGTLVWKTSKYTTKYFLLAIVLAGVTNTFIPQDWIVRTLGGTNFSVLLAASMGLPLYMCGGGAVPLIWQLMQMGMDKGAALAFFIAGPATRIAPMVTVYLLVKQKAFFFYFVISFISAIVLGYIYRWI